VAYLCHQGNVNDIGGLLLESARCFLILSAASSFIPLVGSCRGGVDLKGHFQLGKQDVRMEQTYSSFRQMFNYSRFIKLRVRLNFFRIWR
jgi:hypothetical protein